MNIQDLLSLPKPVAAIALAGMTYIGEVAAKDIDGIPDWINRLGLPIAFLCLVIYALIESNKDKKNCEEGRREDGEKYSNKLEEIIVRGEKSRSDLIQATNEQTREIKNLAEQIKSRP
jgi:low affinity Fe/Cu permease